MDSDPVRRQGPERDNAEGEVVLGASPPARLCRNGKGGPFGMKTRAPAKPARALGGIASDVSAACLSYCLASLSNAFSLRCAEDLLILGFAFAPSSRSESDG